MLWWYPFTITIIISTNLASSSKGVECHLASNVVTIDLELLDLHDKRLAFDNRINKVANNISEIWKTIKHNIYNDRNNVAGPAGFWPWLWGLIKP